MDPRTEAWQDLFDRGTSPQRLQEIALNYPDFRQAVLEHPNVYPELADWIAQQPAAVTPQPEVPAHAGSEFAPGKGYLPDDDLRPSVPLETPTSGSRLPKILLVSAVSVLALALVGGLIFWLTIGRKIQGAATPEGAVEKLIAATVEADPLSLYGSLAPSEIAPMRELLEEAKSLQGVEGSDEAFSGLEEIWAELEISVTDLEFDLVVLDEGITRVDVIAGEVTIKGNERELKNKILEWAEHSLETSGLSEELVDGSIAEMEYGLEDFFDYNWPVNAEIADLFDAAESHGDYNRWFTGVPIVTVEEGGRWYVSPLLTYGELFRVMHETSYYNAGPYRYGKVPDALDAASPQEAFTNLAAGVERLVERGRPNDFIAALPLAERRLFGLHSAMFENAQGGGKLDIAGTVQVISQIGNRSILRPDGVVIVYEDEWNYTYEYEFDGLCGTYTDDWSYSSRFCLDKDLDDAAGFDLGLDLTNLGLVAVRENGNWHLSIVNSLAQLAAVALENIDQEFLDNLEQGIESQRLSADDKAAESDLRTLAITVEVAAVECWGDYSRVEIMDRGFVVDVYCDGWESGSAYLSSDTQLIDWDLDYYSFTLTAESGSGKSITYDSAAGGILPY